MVTFSPAQTFRSKCKTSVIPVWGIWLILENGSAVCLFVCFCFEYIWVHQLPFNVTSRAAWKTMSMLKYKASHLQESHGGARSNPEETPVARHSWQQMRPGTGPRNPRLCCLSHPLCSQGGLLFYRCLWNICMHKRTNHKPVVVFCFSFLSETLFWDQGRETERFVKQHPTRNINLLRK